MKIRNRNRALAAITLGAFATLPTAGAYASDTSAEIRLLKERLKQLEAKVAKQDREAKETRAEAHHATNVVNAAAQGGIVCKDAHCPAPPPPVFVTFKNGLFVETADHAYSFKVGGRIFVDGGGSSEPELGKAGNVGIRRARLEVEGKVASYWLYKLQYDFAGNNVATAPGGSTTSPIGGMRDAYIALKYPGLSVPFATEPLAIQVGNFYEPMGLDAITSSKYIDFIERSMANDAFAPFRHVGFAVSGHGADWSVKGGIYSTSFEDKAISPSAGIPVPLWVPSKAGWVATGGGQYLDLTGRATYAPIMEEDKLLHLGMSGRYHRPNDSTAGNDDRVLALGSNIKTENNILSENLLGTPDLSCGTVVGVAGKCTQDVLSYGGEISGAYGPFAVQAEYLGAHYARNTSAIAYARALNGFAPGGSSQDFGGYYVYGTWYLTGESRAASYEVKGLNGAEFTQIKIKHPLSAGGWGAWEVGLRYSEVNMNSGPFQGSYYQNLVALAPNATTRNAIGNAGIVGGREANLTAGLNWYPEKGFRVMANWTRVMDLSAPYDRAYLNGAHPNIFLVRTQVDW
jgi:phosphate-selective porin OprO and OprP